MLRPEDHKLKLSLGNWARPCLSGEGWTSYSKWTEIREPERESTSTVYRLNQTESLIPGTRVFCPLLEWDGILLLDTFQKNGSGYYFHVSFLWNTKQTKIKYQWLNDVYFQWNSERAESILIPYKIWRPMSLEGHWNCNILQTIRFIVASRIQQCLLQSFIETPFAKAQGMQTHHTSKYKLSWQTLTLANAFYFILLKPRSFH